MREFLIILITFGIHFKFKKENPFKKEDKEIVIKLETL